MSVSVYEVESYIIRRNCAICKGDSFDAIAKFPHFPTVLRATAEPLTGHTYELSLICCKTCGCFQLEKLINPSIIYTDEYLTASYSPYWIRHNNSLADFIVENTSSNKFMEIGANSGGLFKILKEKRALEFGVLDMFKGADLPSEVEFHQGNCENFDFTGNKTLILSHVFEHLYKPFDFVESIDKANVEEVFISIPNFDLLLKNKQFHTVYSQHTYFCGIDHIKYLFAKHHFSCSAAVEFQNCWFIKFTHNKEQIPLETPTIDMTLIKETYIAFPKTLESKEIPENTYICPAGIYGQIFYYFNKYKGNVIGFVDNDVRLHNKYMFSTDKIVISPKDIDYDTSTIAIIDSPYKYEIMEGIRRINPSTKFIEI